MLLSYTVFSIVRFIPSLLLQVQMSAVQFDHRTIPSDHLILAVKRDNAFRNSGNRSFATRLPRLFSIPHLSTSQPFRLSNFQPSKR